MIAVMVFGFALIVGFFWGYSYRKWIDLCERGDREQRLIDRYADELANRRFDHKRAAWKRN